MAETDYTPGRVLRLLPRLPYLRLDIRPSGGIIRVGGGRRDRAVNGAMEERLHTLADLERALFSLPEEDYLAVVLVLIWDLELADAAELLGWPQSTVGRRCLQAVRQMAAVLGWEDPSYQQEALPLAG